MPADTTFRRPLPPRPSTGTLPTAGIEARRGPSLVDNATVVRRLDLSPSITRLTIHPDVPPPRVEPGQYLSIGLRVDGALLQRPYSTASPVGAQDELEFLIRLVRGGALTPRLWGIGVGDRLHLGRPRGLFTRIPDDRRTHLFIATGTGLAPFVAMTATLLRQAVPPPMVLVHGVAHVAELAWREEFEAWSSAGSVVYIPAISRPEAPANAVWDGRTGRIDAILESVWAAHGLDRGQTVAYLCGNPEMITTARRILTSLGLAEDAVRSEQYWPS